MDPCCCRTTTDATAPSSLCSYEGFRNSTPSQTLGRVPTASQLTGNLSDLGVPIYNPFTTRPDPTKPGQFVRDPFPGGIIPQNLLDPAMSKLAQGLYPTPTGTGTTNFSATSPVHTNQDLYNIRGDQQFGTKDSFWFRFSQVTLPRISINPIGNSQTNDTWHAHTIGANWTHTFGPGTGDAGAIRPNVGHRQHPRFGAECARGRNQRAVSRFRVRLSRRPCLPAAQRRPGELPGHASGHRFRIRAHPTSGPGR